MKKETVIIIYSSVDGQTKKICTRIKDALDANHHSVDMVHINSLTTQIDTYDKVLLASSIRYGKHNEDIEKFIHANAKVLNSKKAAFVSVNLVARKEEKSKPDTNPYVIKFLDSIPWQPRLVAVFAGTLNYSMYTFKDRILIKLIMLITKGPINSKTNIEYTNWDNVDTFIHEFSALA